MTKLRVVVKPADCDDNDVEEPWRVRLCAVEPTVRPVDGLIELRPVS